MANIFDYLTDVQYDSFYDLPLNELDVLALTELTYLPFDNLLDQPCQSFKRCRNTCSARKHHVDQ